MDGMTLLAEARAAGLHVSAEGDRLIVRGPWRLSDMAQRVLERKPAILDALRGPVDPRLLETTCGIRHGAASAAWRSKIGGHWTCAVCHPPVSAEIVAERIGEWGER